MFQLIQSYRVTGNLDSVRSSANRSRHIVRVDISHGVSTSGIRGGTIDGFSTGEQG